MYFLNRLYSISFSSVSYARSSIFNTCSHWSLLVDFFLPSPLLCLLSSSLSLSWIITKLILCSVSNLYFFSWKVTSSISYDHYIHYQDWIGITRRRQVFHVETLQELYGISWFFLWYVSDFTIDMSLDLSWNPLSCKNTISFSVLLLDSSYVVIVCVSCSTISCISVREIIFSRYDRQHIEIFLMVSWLISSWSIDGCD